MHIDTLDPISMNEVTVLTGAPYVVEGGGYSSLIIYFENEANRRLYLELSGLSGIARMGAVPCFESDRESSSAAYHSSS